MNERGVPPPSWANPDGVRIRHLILGGGAAAFGIVLVALGVAIGALTSMPKDPLAMFDSVLLLLIGLFLSFYWTWIGGWEGDLLNKVGNGVLPETPWFALILIALAGGLFFCLLVASLWPPAFGFFLLLLKGDETLNIHVAAPRIEKGIDDALRLKVIPAEQDQPLISLAGWQDQAAILDRFFFGHPWYHLATAYTVVIGIATVISTYLATSTDANVRNAGFSIVTAVAVACIVGNEVVATMWRRQRQAEMVLNAWKGRQNLPFDPPSHNHYPRLGSV